MTKSELEHIIDRYLAGNATEHEVRTIEQFYETMSKPEMEWKDSDKIKIRERLYRKIISRAQRKSIRLRYQISAAAAILLIVGVSYFLWKPFSEQTELGSADHKEIVVTAEDDQKSVLLSDGTYILLSKGSTISYSDHFNLHRQIKLTGEAWFDVQRDDHHPFQVITDEVTTTVLGTSFQINTNPETSKVEVKVTSGRVQVTAQDKEIAVLEKDEQLEYQAGQYKIEREGPISDLTTLPLPEPGSWKLANITMGEAVSFIEKRWNTTIEFENMEIRDCPLYASFNADDTMEDVLMILCEVSHSKYRQEEGIIKIYGQGCEIKREPME